MTERCIFCDEQDGDLYQVLTLQVDSDVRKMAIEMEDSKMKAKIACEDMVALGSKYHTKCLLSYRRKFNKLTKNAENNTEKDDMKASQARAFAELIIYMHGKHGRKWHIYVHTIGASLPILCTCAFRRNGFQHTCT